MHAQDTKVEATLSNNLHATVDLAKLDAELLADKASIRLHLPHSPIHKLSF